ncbi:ABC transporter substrate-binding protein [Cryobacterium melibiosiphilum]|uniref:ABC transporter substrate-binding protein n=1 Tax=Cryobacterium melibiosiphilum TaxID=995039 RepID=A0A3A5MQU0_9MICO|nr:ABC transporter substrate-binding protein [Cryobacterium melibiosiphilum]RJT89353.1 ABC transporter substrate-binding protein [Cryobacterium melibiosiphilum]
MRARFVLPALGAVAALLLTGCVDNSTPAPETNGAATSVTADDAAVALLPADVAASGELSIGTDAAYPPNEYKDSAGAPIGWGIDLATAIAGKLGLDPDFQISKFDNIIPSIVGEKINIGESSFTVNPARMEQVDFVNYYEAGIQWASATGTDVDPDNACGLRVAVQATTVQDTDEIPAKSDACVAAGLEPIEKLQFDTQDLATNAVVLGQADALSADSPVTLYAISQNDGELQAAGDTFDVTPYGIAVAKGNGMAEAIQAALQSLVDDGTYEEILDEWGVADGGISTITINELAAG